MTELKGLETGVVIGGTGKVTGRGGPVEGCGDGGWAELRGRPCSR